MTDKAISPLRRRLIEDMTIRRLSPKTQYQYIRHVKKFADFLGRSADKATAEDVHRYQLWLASSGTSVGTANVSATALRFFFKLTLKRHDLAKELISTREPRRLPVVLSPEEVGRLLAAATNIKHRAILSLAYATGLRASEVVSLKLTDIDRNRMVIRVEQGKSLPSRKRGARRIGTSFSRPSCSHEWWRVARKKGWMSAGQPWLFPGYRGQHTSARQLHRIVRLAAGVPASPSVSAFIRCGTASPPISWSRRPIFGSSKFYSVTRHTAREHATEAKVHYPYHPQFGEAVIVRRRLFTHNVEMAVILQPDGSLACLPAWMLAESAAQYRICRSPTISIAFLQSLRVEIDALLASLPSNSEMGDERHAAKFENTRKRATRAVRANPARNRGDTGPATTADDADRSPAERDRLGARNRGGRQ